MHCNITWKPPQGAVYWVHFARSQEKRLKFWKTRSRAIILYDSVPADCIGKSGMPSRRQNYTSKDFHASSRSKDSSQSCLVNKAAATAAAARHTLSSSGKPFAEGGAARHSNKQRETASGGKSNLKLISGFLECHKMQCSKIKEE